MATFFAHVILIIQSDSFSTTSIPREIFEALFEYRRSNRVRYVKRSGEMFYESNLLGSHHILVVSNNAWDLS